jgi:hypothetical protein
MKELGEHENSGMKAPEIKVALAPALARLGDQ